MSYWLKVQSEAGLPSLTPHTSKHGASNRADTPEAQRMVA